MRFAFGNEQATCLESVLGGFQFVVGIFCLAVKLANQVSQHCWRKVVKAVGVCAIDCCSHDCKVPFAVLVRVGSEVAPLLLA